MRIYAKYRESREVSRIPRSSAKGAHCAKRRKFREAPQVPRSPAKSSEVPRESRESSAKRREVIIQWVNAFSTRLIVITYKKMMHAMAFCHKLMEEFKYAYNTLVKDANGKYYYAYINAVALLNQADSTDAAVQYYLGECYYFGRGVPKNLQKASDYLYRSSTQGYPKAFCLIGTMIENREYVEEGGYDYSDPLKNLNVVFASYKSAVEKDQNDSDAKLKLATFRLFEIGPLYEQGSQGHIYNQVAAVELLKKAALQMSAGAYFMLGQLAGIPGATDISTPQIDLYLSAAKLGQLSALKYICQYYIEHKNIEEAVWWYWWAKKYDPSFVSKEIDDSSDLLTEETLYTMRHDCDKRLYDKVHAMWFTEAFTLRYETE
jgi:TPR repeat protein